MFKKSAEADDLAEAMRRSLFRKEAEVATHSKRMNRAFDRLNKAAQLLENAGYDQDAELVTRAMEEFARIKK